jgi:hypothetical protein
MRFLVICYWINILTIAFYIFIIFAALLRMHSFLHYVFYDPSFLNIRMAFAIPIVILWINNLIVWSKKDKNIGRFFVLFFLMGIYSPFYFKKILKNNWQ